MTELMAQAISSIVEEQFAKNAENVQKTIISGIDESMSTDAVYAKMLINSLHLSVKVSVQIMSELLLKANVIEAADEEQLRKTLLSVVKD